VITWSRGHAEPVQDGLDGRLEARSEAQRHVVDRLLGDVVGARLVSEAALAVVVTARDVRVYVNVNERRRRLTQRPQTVVVEHGQARARVDERLGRHLRHTCTCRRV